MAMVTYMKKEQRIVRDTLIAYSPIGFNEIPILTEVLNKELFGGVEVIR